MTFQVITFLAHAGSGQVATPKALCALLPHIDTAAAPAYSGCSFTASRTPHGTAGGAMEQDLCADRCAQAARLARHALVGVTLAVRFQQRGQLTRLGCKYAAVMR